MVVILIDNLSFELVYHCGTNAAVRLNIFVIFTKNPLKSKMENGQENLCQRCQADRDRMRTELLFT